MTGKLLPTSTLNDSRYSNINLEPLLLLFAVYYVWGLLLLVKLIVEGVFLIKFISLAVGVNIVCTPAPVVDASSLRVRASLSTSCITFWWKEERWLVLLPALAKYVEAPLLAIMILLLVDCNGKGALGVNY